MKLLKFITLVLCEYVKPIIQEEEKIEYQNLLFIHEDTEFETKKNGLLLLDELNLSNCGIVGVARSRYLPSVPFGWLQLKTESVRNYTQYDQGQFHRYKIDEIIKIEVLDDVFLAIKLTGFDKCFFISYFQDFRTMILVFHIGFQKGIKIM